MQVTEIPLSSGNQTFQVSLGSTTYMLRIIWRDVAGWIMDVQDSSGAPLLCGVPLITGVNLLEQYPELGINGALTVDISKGEPEYPTATNLGAGSRLYFVLE